MNQHRPLSLRPLRALRHGASILVGLALLGQASDASACGGFWCSQSAPVNQTAEQILFVDNDDGTTTCVVQINYQGPSERFAWVLPVAGVPKVAISSNVAIQRLSQATQPTYVLERHVEGECAMDYALEDAFAGAPNAGGAPPPTASGPSVQVLDQGSVGPYDYATILPDPALPSPADAAIEWLTAEGYDITGISADVLGPYLADGMNLIAFRLTKGTESGSIRPVALTYEGDSPSIPIRPTAVAAQDDMGILVWVGAQAQAVPKNYRSLLINESLINWFNPLSNYDQVVTQAANEAGGQGFVTEFAGPSDAFDQTIFGVNDAEGWNQIQQTTYPDPIDLIWAANNYYRGWDGWRETIEEAVTLPPGGTLDEFGRNPDVYRGVPGFSVNAELFLELLYSDVIEPVLDTQRLLDSQPYLTRLYSTMSADEMTIDPVFALNAELARVSNVHTANLFIECNPDIYEWEAPWRIMLPGGGTLVGFNQQDPWPVPMDSSAPANVKVVQLAETGSGEVVADNTQAVFASIRESGGIASPPMLADPPPDEGMPIGGGYDAPTPVAGSEDASGCGCAVPGQSRSRGAWSLVALGLGAALLGRRRRAR